MTLTVKTLALGMLALALGASVACAPEKPAAPTYAKDVARSSRPTAAVATVRRGPVAACKATHRTGKKPAACKFDFYDSSDTATCTVAAGAVPPISCWGAHYCVTGSPYAMVISQYIRGEMDACPTPASLMNDWEIDVVTAWLKNPLP